MYKHEILEKAIKKAKENGYNGRPHNNEGMDDVLYDCSVIDIIFNHEFCKAFFGEKWQYHLQQMVLQDEPIEYLEKFL